MSKKDQEQEERDIIFGDKYAFATENIEIITGGASQYHYVLMNLEKALNSS